MKAAQKKPIKIDLSRSLCKQVSGGVGSSKDGGPKVAKAETKQAPVN